MLQTIPCEINATNNLHLFATFTLNVSKIVYKQLFRL